MDSTTGLVSCVKNLITSGEDIYSDYTVEVAGQIFPCHRFVLSACSPFFQGLFRSGMKDSKLDSTSLVGFSSETFNVMYKFIYLQENSLNENNVLEVWSAAHFLQISFIISECQQIVLETVNAKNCHRYLQQARLLDEKVTAILIRFIKHNFDRFKDSACIMELEFEELMGIVRDADLMASREENVVNAILKWVDHSESRTDYLIPLLSVSRLTLMKTKSLTTLFQRLQTLGNKSALDLISKVSMYLSGCRPNYWPSFASRRNCSYMEDVVMMPSGLKFIAIFSLSEKTIVGVLDSSELPRGAIYNLHKRQVYSCGYTADSRDSLSMFLMEEGEWQKVSTVKFSDDVNQKGNDLEAAIQILITFSVGDRIIVVHANTGDIFDWDPVKRTDIKQVTSVPTGMLINYATVFQSSIIVICAALYNKSTLSVYDITRREWQETVTIEGITASDDLTSFYKEDSLYVFTSNGKLYLVQNVDDKVTLKHITTVSNFSESLIGSQVYCEDLFLFVREYPQYPVCETHPVYVEFPELFRKVHVIGTPYPCTSLVPTCLPKLILRP